MRELEPHFGIEVPLSSQKHSTRFVVGSIALPGTTKPDFQALFRHLPGIFVATAPDFTIAAASDDMRRKTFTWREEILGRDIFEVFPDNPLEEYPHSTKKFQASLRDVFASGATHSMRVLRYDIQDRLGDGAWIEKYWSVISRPVIDRSNREVLYVLTEGRDITRITHLALWLERIGTGAELAPDMQRTVERVQQDAMRQAPRLELVRARLAEEMKLTGATPETLIGELKALLRTPENRLYACAGELVSESGVYVSYHRGDCTFAPRVRYFAEGVQFPSCARCGNDVLYRLSRKLS